MRRARAAAVAVAATAGALLSWHRVLTLMHHPDFLGVCAHLRPPLSSCDCTCRLCSFCLLAPFVPVLRVCHRSHAMCVPRTMCHVPCALCTFPHALLLMTSDCCCPAFSRCLSLHLFPVSPETLEQLGLCLARHPSLASILSACSNAYRLWRRMRRRRRSLCLMRDARRCRSSCLSCLLKAALISRR